MKETPNNTLLIQTHNNETQKPFNDKTKNNIPMKRNKFLNNLKKCQPSVKPTNNVVEKGNFGPLSGSPFLYLFLHDTTGSQNNCFLKLLNIDLKK